MVRINVITEGLACLNKLDTVKPLVAKKEHTVIKVTSINITRDKYFTGNESTTDFRYTLALLRFGVSDEDITSRLFNERQNWENKSEHKELREQYITRTIENARKLM